jgi:hypothetical protein
MAQKTSLTVFYSWQSDLPRETNQRAISSCIKTAFISIEENNETITLNYDEATRGEPGSPDIPSTIFNKISAADIFLCDITTINHSESTKRKTSNPNVLIELGYAISILGWERIIMVFNKNFGDFESELPFDLEKRRLTSFTIKDKTDKGGKSDLILKLTTDIETIIKKNPAKPSEIKAKGEKEIKREKDIANLKILMSCIHIPTFDLFATELPDRIVERIFFFWYSFEGNYDSNTFHIYDKTLSEKLKDFRISWGNSLSYGHLFHISGNTKYYHLYLPMDVFTEEKSEESFNELTKETLKLREIFKELIIYIRENYLELDLNELSDKAIQNYIDYEKESLDKLEP